MDLGESNLTGSVPSLDFLYRADALKETLKEASIPPQKCPTLPHVRAKYAQWTWGNRTLQVQSPLWISCIARSRLRKRSKRLRFPHRSVPHFLMSAPNMRNGPGGIEPYRFSPLFGFPVSRGRA